MLLQGQLVCVIKMDGDRDQIGEVVHCNDNGFFIKPQRNPVKRELIEYAASDAWVWVAGLTGIFYPWASVARVDIIKQPTAAS